MTARSEPQTVLAVDGRVRRGVQSRNAIVGALFELIGSGVLRPTAQQVADRGGVGIRSVFRHFSEMESLYAAVDARLESEAARLLYGGERSGPLAARARALVRQRITLFERVAPYKRSANLQRWRSRFIQGRHLRMQRLLHDDLLEWLPELARAPQDLVVAFDLATSFEAWDRLRGDRGLSPKLTAAALERTALALARDLESASRRRAAAQRA
ncbi:MAG: TetR/AcrR family transcriptional regulator [Deltaproteobacteria bacterium]|nr:TetR/AcrR family transcriptional regulator [Deltaproteobacteria bacterium]